MARGEQNGVDGLRLLSRGEMRALEPNITGAAAILSEATGIIDAHGLMKSFAGRA
jgi:L-2-hydroxyglutarate oxidase LhgO